MTTVLRKGQQVLVTKRTLKGLKLVKVSLRSFQRGFVATNGVAHTVDHEALDVLSYLPLICLAGFPFCAFQSLYVLEHLLFIDNA